MKVTSSNIEDASYDPKEGSLKVRFKNSDKIYKYPCTPEEFKKLLHAPSKGKYFKEHIQNRSDNS